MVREEWLRLLDGAFGLMRRSSFLAWNTVNPLMVEEARAGAEDTQIDGFLFSPRDGKLRLAEEEGGNGVSLPLPFSSFL